MKKILCFGDSNTFGYNPSDGSRYDRDTRWTGILSKLLCGKFEVDEAGCNNRTAFSINPDGDNFTGFKILPEYLKTFPECAILQIGINDIQTFYNPSISDFKKGLSVLVKIIKEKSKKTEILLLIPSILTSDVLSGGFKFQFNQTSVEKSALLPALYKEIAQENGIHFIDLNLICELSPADGLHYSPHAHKLIALAVFDFLKNSVKLVD